MLHIPDGHLRLDVMLAKEKELRWLRTSAAVRWTPPPLAGAAAGAGGSGGGGGGAVAAAAATPALFDASAGSFGHRLFLLRQAAL